MQRCFISVVLGCGFLWAGDLAAQGQAYEMTSAYGLRETVARFESALHAEGIEAQRNGPDPANTNGATEEFVFANPFASSYAGRCRWDDRQDKPFNTRIWQEPSGKVMLSYTAPAERVNEYGVIECGSVVARIHKTLNKIVKYAAQ